MNSIEKTNNIISVLHSPTNYKNIVNGVSFKQIALIMYKKRPYYILSPLVDLSGDADNLAMVFMIQEDNDNFLVTVPESIERAVFKKYYSIYSKQQKGEVGADGSILKSEIIYESFMLLGDIKLQKLKRKAVTEKKHSERKKIIDVLNQHVKGQGAVIECAAKHMVGEKQTEGPVVLTLVGAAGTGKTTLGQGLAQATNRNILILQGSMFGDENSSAQRLTGFDPNYRAGYLGLFMKKMLESGKLLVLIDEVDQFANDVRSIMFPWFSEGTTTDAFLGVTVSIKDVIFIICANSCKNIYEKGGMMADVPMEKIAESLSKEVDAKGRRVFPKPLISRMVSCGAILMYNNISPSSMQEIIKEEVNKKTREYHKNGIEYHLDNERLSSLLLFNRPGFDARQLKGEVKKLFNEIQSASYDIAVEENAGYIDRINIDILDYESELSSITDKKEHSLLFFGDRSDVEKLGANIVFGDENYDSYFTRSSEIEAILIDATNSIEDARRIFLEVKDRNINNLPIYLYSKHEVSRSRLAKFTEGGASDIYVPTREMSLDEWFAHVIHGLEIEAICRALNNRGIHMNYDIDYEVKNHTLSVSIVTQISDDITKYAEGKRLCLDEDDLRRASLHEASHGVIAYKLLGVSPDNVSVISRGAKVGYVSYSNNSILQTESMLRDRICIALAGRVGEKIFLGDNIGVNTGAASDLEHATNIASEMITKLGMAGSISVSEHPNKSRVDEILSEEYKRTEALISENRDVIVRVSNALFEKRYLSKKDFERIISNVG